MPDVREKHAVTCLSIQRQELSKEMATKFIKIA
jgi:hypothetical protein